jgi:hypothetical protein
MRRSECTRAPGTLLALLALFSSGASGQDVAPFEFRGRIQVALPESVKGIQVAIDPELGMILGGSRLSASTAWISAESLDGAIRSVLRDHEVWVDLASEPLIATEEWERWIGFANGRPGEIVGVVADPMRRLGHVLTFTRVEGERGPRVEKHWIRPQYDEFASEDIAFDRTTTIAVDGEAIYFAASLVRKTAGKDCGVVLRVDDFRSTPLARRVLVETYPKTEATKWATWFGRSLVVRDDFLLVGVPSAPLIGGGGEWKGAAGRVIACDMRLDARTATREWSAADSTGGSGFGHGLAIVGDHVFIGGTGAIEIHELAALREGRRAARVVPLDAANGGSSTRIEIDGVADDLALFRASNVVGSISGHARRVPGVRTSTAFPADSPAVARLASPEWSYARFVPVGDDVVLGLVAFPNFESGCVRHVQLDVLIRRRAHAVAVVARGDGAQLLVVDPSLATIESQATLETGSGSSALALDDGRIVVTRGRSVAMFDRVREEFSAGSDLLPGDESGEARITRLVPLADFDSDRVPDFAAFVTKPPAWHVVSGALIQCVASLPVASAGAIAAIGDFDLDGALDVAVGDPSARSGRGEVVVQATNGFTPSRRIVAPPGVTNFGSAVVAHGFLHRDVPRELWIGAATAPHDGAGASRGCVFRYRGRGEPLVELDIGVTLGSRLAFATIGDVDGDRVPETVILADSGGGGACRLLVFGTVSPTILQHVDLRERGFAPSLAESPATYEWNGGRNLAVSGTRADGQPALGLVAIGEREISVRIVDLAAPSGER